MAQCPMNSSQAAPTFAVDPVCLSSVCCWVSFEKSARCMASCREAEMNGLGPEEVSVGPKTAVGRTPGFVLSIVATCWIEFLAHAFSKDITWGEEQSRQFGSLF